MTLKTDIDQLVADAAIMHDIIHGGAADSVTTDGGTVKSVAHTLADLEAQIISDADSYLSQCQDEVTLATAQATTATNQAAAAAASALSAASVVSQDLSAIDRTVFSATIVDAFLYDTSKDSDGGAWRKRCAHTSWENETLSGNWLGSAANETAARAISGATTGSYYYDTTAAGFYTLNAGSGKTATYRGNVRQFPAQVLITVEAARVVLWDLTQAGAPMWMVFAVVSSASAFMYAANGNTAVAAANGVLLLTQSGGGLAQAGFIPDNMQTRLVSGLYPSSLKISGRHSAWATTGVVSAGAIAATACNDVAMTVLPNAPIDVATGLPVPTIAVATDGNATYSTSVLMNDGTVVNIASDSTGTAVGVEFDGLALKVIRSDGTVYYWNDVRALTTGAAASATVSASTTPAALGTASKQAKRALSSSTGVTLMLRNQLTLASSMLAYITKDYNSGWQVGAIKGAWLADTVAETLTGAEMVTNGNFATDISGWTNNSTGTGSIAWNASGYLDLTGAGTSNRGWAVQLLSLVAGKSYVITVNKVAGAAETQLVVGNLNTYPLPAGISTFSFIAVASDSVAVNCYGTGTVSLDVVSIRLADVDRSVKAKGLQAFGSLTKAAVASGAQLMGYSGFSAANYLEQPYNSDLDFGTGDFCIMGWYKSTGKASTVAEFLFVRGYYSGAYSGGYISLYLGSDDKINFVISDDGLVTTDTCTSTSTQRESSYYFVCAVRRGAALELWVNGIKAATDTTISAATASLNNASAVCRLGLTLAGTLPASASTLAMFRASATSPSAEQIKHIYETEKRLFEANAQCCLAGTSNAVTALAYDDETDLLHVGTSYGRSAFKGLVRTASEATAVGAITALSAGAGVIVQGGATAVDVYVPAYTLREELLRDAEQMARFGKNLIAHDFTATASQTTFTLPVGWEIVAVYQQGSIKRETTSWSKSFDGFKWSAVLGTGATVSDWISILAKRV